MAPEIDSMNSILPISLESILMQLAQACLWPVMACILFAFAYALVSLGAFALEMVTRWRSPQRLLHFSRKESDSIEQMELSVLKELEGLRLCSRISPMLGLVATMIPLGPALVSATSGNVNQSQNAITELAAAFAAVIISLVAASITFAIHTVRRRWLLWELTQAVEGRSS